MKHTVREIRHEVRVDLPDRPVIKTPTGQRRKLYRLRLEYGIRRDVARVDITVESRDSAELYPPVMEMPGWMREIVEAHRPADVDGPDTDRRTGMGGWPLPEPAGPEGDVPGFHDPATLHATVARGLRALGLSPGDAAKYAAAHQQDAFDRAGEAIEDEAWPHERPEHENQRLYRLADKIRGLPVATVPVELAADDGTTGICWCGEVKRPGANHSMCYPGME